MIYNLYAYLVEYSRMTAFRVLEDLIETFGAESVQSALDEIKENQKEVPVITCEYGE
jgi:hypothetical protein